ncbi:MAG: hypothetical protein LCH30_04395 [Proteobacteria bacterium]|nr:hypothetical protein [Pseudomonadota bacterium]
MPTLKKLEQPELSRLDFYSLDSVFRYSRNINLIPSLFQNPKLGHAVSMRLNKAIKNNYDVDLLFKTMQFYSPVTSYQKKAVVTTVEKLSVKHGILGLNLITSNLLNEKSTLPLEIAESWNKNYEHYREIFFPLLNKAQRALILEGLLERFDKAVDREAHHALDLIFSLVIYLNEKERARINLFFLSYLKSKQCGEISFRLIKFLGELAKTEEISDLILSSIVNEKGIDKKILELAFENFFAEEEKGAILDSLLSHLDDKNFQEKELRVFLEVIALYANYFEETLRAKALTVILDHLAHPLAWNALDKLVPDINEFQVKIVIQRLTSIEPDDAYRSICVTGDLTIRFKALKPFLLNEFLYHLRNMCPSDKKKLLRYSWHILKAFHGNADEEDKQCIAQVISEILFLLKGENDSEIFEYALKTLKQLAEKCGSQKEDFFNQIIILAKENKSFCEAIPYFVGDAANKNLAIDTLLFCLNNTEDDEVIWKAITPLTLDKSQKDKILIKLLSGSTDFLMPVLRLLVGSTPSEKQEILAKTLAALGSRSYEFLYVKPTLSYLNPVQKKKILSDALAYINENNDYECRYIFAKIITLLLDNIEEHQKQPLVDFFKFCLEAQDWDDVLKDTNFDMFFLRIDEEQRQQLLDELLGRIPRMVRFISYDKRSNIIAILSRLCDLASHLGKKQRKQILDAIFNILINSEDVYLLSSLEKQFFFQLDVFECQEYWGCLIKIIQDEKENQKKRFVALETGASVLMQIYNESLYESETNKRYELKDKLRRYLLAISPHVSNEEHFLLQHIKVQLQRAEWAIELEEFKESAKANHIERLIALLANPLLQPFPAKAGFAPTIELQTNFIKLGCLYLSLETLHLLNKKIIALSLESESLLVKGTIGQALLAYELSLSAENTLQEELKQLIPDEIKSDLEPLIEYFKPVELNLPEERNYNRALKRLTFILNNNNEWYSLCSGNIGELIRQIKLYKEAQAMPLHDLTAILEDTSNLFLLKISMEDYQANTQGLVESKDCIDKMLLAYKSLLTGQDSLLEPVIELPAQAIEPLVSEEQCYLNALEKLASILERPKQWYSQCNNQIEKLVQQIKLYKEEGKVPLCELTSILEDTSNLLLKKMPIADYKAKAKNLEGKASRPLIILGGLMMAVAVIVGVMALAVGGLALPATLTVAAAVAVGVTFFAKGAQSGLAKTTTNIAESLDEPYNL